MRTQTHFQRPVTIWVRNNGSGTHRDRFDGEDFEIRPGDCLEMPPEAATLCFGVGDEDKTRVIRRLGWARTQNDFQTALDRLNQFSFHGSEEDARAEDKPHTPAPVVADKGARKVDEDGDPVPSRTENSLLGKLARAQATAPA